MTTVLKIGGTLLDDPVKAAGAIQAKLTGPAVVVHGGGKQITRMLERMNAESRFIDGLRVTDEHTLHVVSLALLGEVHANLVQAMQTAQLPAVGLFGAVQAQRREGPWGLVGSAVKTDAASLKALLQAGKIPVIPTLATSFGSLLNVNGDETAAALAVDLGARRLIFLTDVPGVQDETGGVIDRPRDVDQLLNSSFVSGGMLPKLRAVKAALVGGVRQVSVGQTVFEVGL